MLELGRGTSQHSPGTTAPPLPLAIFWNSHLASRVGVGQEGKNCSHYTVAYPDSPSWGEWSVAAELSHSGHKAPWAEGEPRAGQKQQA